MSIWNSIGEWIQKLEAGVAKLIKEAIVPSIDFLNAVKKYINNPVFDYFANLISGGMAQGDINLLTNALTAVINALGILADGSLGTPAASAASVNSTNAVKVYSNYIKKLPPTLQDATHFKVASMIAKTISGTTKFPQNEIDKYTQEAYSESVKSKSTIAS